MLSTVAMWWYNPKFDQLTLTKARLITFILQFIFVPSEEFLSLHDSGVHKIIEIWPDTSGESWYPSGFTRDILPVCEYRLRSPFNLLVYT